MNTLCICRYNSHRFEPMASSAFKSTTKRASIGADDSGRRSLRRSRSLSRLPHPMALDPDSDADYNKNVPRGKFVNTTRGSPPTTSFPDISLDDLALELFSSSSDGVVVERKEREGRSVGRWASDTASSRRKGRSVSRTRGDVVSGAKNVNSTDAVLRRRRSLSVARRYQISDSESEVDHFRNLSSRATVKAPFNGNCQLSSVQNTVASSTRRVGRSRSIKDSSLIHDGYLSHSSALTDDDSKDTHFGKHGFEKIIRAVHAQKAEHPNEDVTDGGLYEAMRKEVRYAVQEIRTELNQAMGRNQTALASGDCFRSDQDFSGVPEKYATKFEQLEKHKQDLLTEMLLEEQRGEQISTMVKELPYSRTSAIAEKPSRDRKRSNDRSMVSTKLFEEAERYFEDFICNNIEDTDISSFDGERSDVSSTVGVKMKERDAIVREAEAYKTHAEFTSHPYPVELDGVILPWLQWETGPEGSLSEMKMAPSPVTPKALQIDSEKGMVLLSDPSSHSISSHGSWNPDLFNTPPLIDRKAACKTRQVDSDCISSRFDMDEYLNCRRNEELLFEIYSQRNRINSGGMLFCTGGFH